MSKQDLTGTISRRTLVLSGGQLVLFSVLFGRMFYLQIIKGKEYKKLSDNNRIRIKYINPERGNILDRNNKEIATNKNMYNLVLIPEESFQGLDPDDFLERLGNIIELTNEDKLEIKKDIKNKKKHLSTIVKQNLNWDEMSKINFKKTDLSGVYIEESFLREYPFENSISHVSGYTGKPSKRDLNKLVKTHPEALNNPDTIIGKAGIEKYFDKELRGKYGKEDLIVNSYGRTVGKINENKQKSLKGYDIQLTIDSDIQKETQKILEDMDVSAGVCVVDVNNGEIISMCSSPSFNPNMFNNKNFNNDEFKELLNNEKKPFLNKNTDGTYPLASTIKPLIALSALENGWNPRKKIYCSKKFEYGGHLYHCWKKHEEQNLVDAIQTSCDVYFYNLGLELGIDKINKITDMFGLSEPSGIELPGEVSGKIPTKDWKIKTFGQNWLHGDTILTSIGQGFCLSNNLQLATMVSRIANGKFKIKPTIIKGKNNDIKFEELEVKKKNLDIVKKGMFKVMNEKNGTALASKLKYKTHRMSGKTGTAQVRRISMKERATGILKGNELPWKYRNHGLFIGYAPHKNPKYAISVIVEHGEGGSTTAAPIGKKVMEAVLKKYL
ncbi:MAG: penicillin-binding protein 2 [Alphaproteobacteria bacterium]|jgi:penicillin-binding protein 2|nr:penicillin-binding protein 2 [Alphaproteobacteria bacterium]